ncbi:MAG TPA: DUF3987 domain-containing protein [Candidatus Dormibacteraeota bacterium]|nr:DUF3987 domain-containing protein [Candidatus Dormibacteraeota bacterium]
MTFEAAALALAAEGFRVIPLQARDKRPLLDNWPDRATTHVEQIGLWWRTWPEANVGIATGNGLVVIDLDAGGQDTLKVLEAELGELPSTRSVTTGSSGLHLYFRLPAGVTQGNSARRLLGAGIDVRADGGQVVAPPSIHPNGRPYVWDDTGPIADLPAAWLERMQRPVRESQSFSLEAGELVPEGGRNDTLYRYGASLRGKGKSDAYIAAALVTFNSERCRPALDSAEVDTVIGSVQGLPMGEAPTLILHGGRLERATEIDDDGVTPAVATLPPFPVDVLPPEASELVKYAALAAGAPNDMVAIPALVVLAAAIGGSRALQVKAGWREYPVLWAAIVAPPSSGKTPSMRAAFSPLREWQADRFAEFTEALEGYQSAEEAWGKTRGSDRGAKPDRPVARRIIVDDFTVEQLVAILHENPRGVAAVKDELSGWVRSLNQYKGGRGSDRSNTLALWSSSHITVDRKLNPVPLYIGLPLVSIVGGLQPALLGELHDGEDGMLERFLFTVQPDATMPLWTDDEIPHHVRQRWELLIRKLMAEIMREGTKGLEPVVLSFTSKGRSAYVAGYDEHVRAMRAGTPAHLLGAWGKMQAQAARLALVLQCARHAMDHAGPEVDEESSCNAWALIDYFKAHAAAALDTATTSTDDRKGDLVLRWLVQRGGSATVRDIYKAAVGGLRAASDVSAVVARLADRGLVKTESIKVRGGQRTEVVAL